MDDTRPHDPSHGFAVLDGGKGGVAEDKPPKDRHRPVFTEPRPIGFDETFKVMPPGPAQLLPSVLPRETFAFIGAGGLIKTSEMLRAQIHCVLNRRYLGIEWTDPGPCLFITAEDSRQLIRYRVRRLCDGLGISDAEQAIVAENLHVEDVTGKLVRFIEMGPEGNLTITRHVDDLIETYSERNVVFVVADPAAFFGAGERLVNDNEATLMQAARRISTGLGGAAVGYIHHTGKKAARDKTTDQYAGRGGSAMADNARAVLSLAPHSAKDEENDSDGAQRPSSILSADVSDGRVFRLHVAKYSYGKRPLDPFWIVRSAKDAYTFTEHKPTIQSSAERQAEENKRQGEMACTVATAAYQQIEWLDKTGTRIGITELVDTLDVNFNGAKLGRNKRRLMLEIAIQKGAIKRCKIPKEDAQRGKSEYVANDRNPEEIIWW